MKDGKLEDADKMPFGKYGPPPKGNGSTMADVPASYFHYLWTTGLEHDRQSPVADYIRRNIGALKQECPDRIW